MAMKEQHNWPDDDKLVEQVRIAGSVRLAAKAMGIPEQTLHSRLEKRGLRERVRAQLRKTLIVADGSLELRVHDLVRRKKRVSVEAIADELDVAPKTVRAALVTLAERGFRVPEEAGVVTLAPVQPDKVNLHHGLFDGEHVRVGIVSDTHLSSNEEALPELELAYTMFERAEIDTVLHAGDFTAGVGVFPGQHSEIHRHTFEDQVDYLEAHYPRRSGIRTIGISGNHDIEGDFGKVGANPVIALANRREDITFAGDYSAWFELPNGAWIHLLHGKGGMSYSYSYKAQKLVDGYPAGRKPAILVPGHWHVSGWIEQRGVQVVWPGCFEWKGRYLTRLGLTPSVGFWIFDMTLGDDGSLVKFAPTFHRYWEGRAVAAA